MELTKEQIQFIDTYLKKIGIKNYDLRIEILDHLSTDIEYKIENSNVTFEEAFKSIISKWKKSFNDTSSFWLGYAFSGPEIMIERLLKIAKPFSIKTCVLAFLIFPFSIILDRHLKLNLDNFKNEVIVFYHFINSIVLITLIYWSIKIYNSKIKTSFSILFYRNLPNLLIHTLVFINCWILENSLLLINLSSFVLTLYFILALIHANKLFKKHFNVVNNIKKLA